MKLSKTNFISDVKIWKDPVYFDKRGWFQEVYKRLNFKKNFIQQNLSLSKKKVARGLHYQSGKYGQTKLVSVVSGSILDIIVDLRKNSKFYGKFITLKMSSKDGNRVLIPSGFAHGFISLEEKTVISYLVDKPYNPKSEGSINLKLIIDQIDIKFKKLIISQKDKNASIIIPKL